ncbi:unnamed protein product, partial [Ectocarpus fasciculatus]
MGAGQRTAPPAQLQNLFKSARIPSFEHSKTTTTRAASEWISEPLHQNSSSSTLSRGPTSRPQYRRGRPVHGHLDGSIQQVADLPHVRQPAHDTPQQRYLLLPKHRQHQSPIFVQPEPVEVSVQARGGGVFGEGGGHAGLSPGVRLPRAVPHQQLESGVFRGERYWGGEPRQASFRAVPAQLRFAACAKA